MAMGVHGVSTSSLVNAGIALGVAIAAAWVLRRVLERRGRRLAEAVRRGELSPEVDTRLRLLRRLLYAVVLGLGIAIALAQFEGVRTVGRALLASGAIAAAVLGFAARQTLANVIAGILIAITQPVRIGDWVHFEDDYGQVEDVTLSFTTLRTLGGSRVIIPNERIAGGVVRNDTLGEPDVGVEVSVWLPRDADVGRALELLDGAVVTDHTFEGVRLAVDGGRAAPVDRARREQRLRAEVLARLRAAGLLEAGATSE